MIKKLIMKIRINNLNISPKKIKTKLLFWFLIVALIPSSFVSYLAINSLTNSLRETENEKFYMLAESKANIISDFFNTQTKVVTMASKSPFIAEILQAYNEAYTYGKDSKEFRDTHKKHQEFLQTFKNEFNSYDLYLMNNKGDLVLSYLDAQAGINRPEEVACYIKELGSTFSQSIQENKVLISECKYHESTKMISSFIITPIYKEKKMIGAFAIQLNLELLFKTVKNASQLGNSGEVLIGELDNDYAVFITQLKFTNDGVFNKKIKIGAVEGKPMQEATQGRDGSGISIDYRGKEVIAIWKYIKQPNWGLVVKMDVDELLFPIQQIRLNFSLIGLSLIFLVIVLALWLSTTISTPISNLQEGMKMVAEGNLTFQLKNTAKDELGSLSRSFDEMTQQLALITASRNDLNKEIQNRKEAQQEINKLSQAIEQSPVSVSIADMNGNLEYVNKRFKEVTGYTEREVIGKNPRFFKSGYHDAEFYKTLWNTILSGEIWKGELVNKMKNGALVWQSATISPLKNDDGEISHFIAIKEDISQRKKIEDQLNKAKKSAEEANKAKSNFLANMSHEIRTPMNAILGYSELLSKQIQVEAQKDYANSIQSSGKTLLKLINNILDLSKIESGNLDLTQEPTNISRTINEIVDMFKEKASKKGLKIEVNISQDLPLGICVDELRVKQILINLINNAIKFTEKGVIRIELLAVNKSQEHCDLQLSVADSGIGMPKEEIQSIFNAFHQVERQDSRKYEGTGLGLAITQQIVKQMNGHIEVKSEIGIGSTFTIFLRKVEICPLTQIGTPVLEFNPYRIQFEKASILVVDDTQSNRNLIKDYLKTYHLKITEAANGNEALKLMKEEKPDLIFMDVNMPILNGCETRQLIRKNPNWKSIPIIAITAAAFSNDEKEIISQGFDGYLRKPTSLSNIVGEMIKFLNYIEVDEVIQEKDQVEEREIKNLNEILVELKSKVLPVLGEIAKLRTKKKIVLLSEILIEIGEKYNADTISNYGKNILAANNSFNIER